MQQTTIRAISKIRRSPRETTTMMKVPKGETKSMAFSQNSVPAPEFGVVAVVDAEIEVVGVTFAISVIYAMVE